MVHARCLGISQVEKQEESILHRAPVLLDAGHLHTRGVWAIPVGSQPDVSQNIQHSGKNPGLLSSLGMVASLDFQFWLDGSVGKI